MKKNNKKIIDSLKTNSKDVGSSEVQIGLLSEKIDNLTGHFKRNKNDKHSTRGTVICSQSKKATIRIFKKKKP